MNQANLNIPSGRVADFCRRNQIRRLAFFGSVLREDFGPHSDVDVLIEFEPSPRAGSLRLAALEIELTEILGRRVDLNTPGFLSDDFRAQILTEAQVQYDAA